MTHEESKRRIRRMSYSSIRLLSAKEIWKLTDSFNEELVREIVAKHRSPRGQREAIVFMKNCRINALQDLHRPFTIHPEYFENWLFDIKTGALVEGAPPVSNVVKIDNPPISNSKTKEQAAANASNVENDVADKLCEYTSRIKELEAENEQLKENIKKKDAEIASMKQQLKEQSNANNTISGIDNTAEIIEQLKPIFWSDEKKIKSFLDKIRGKKNTAVIAVIADGLIDRTISEQSCRRDLWSILDKHRLYRASESNYNLALNKTLAAREINKRL